MVTTPPVCLGRMCATFSCRNSTVFDRTSGTEQLHFSNSGENLYVAIAVSRNDSIALVGKVLPSVLSQMYSVDMPLPKYLRLVLILFL
jgi:hypothetical protein